MDTKVILGATVAGAVGFFGAKVGAGFNDTAALGAGLGFAIFAGGALQMTNKKETVVSDEQAEWEKELAEGAGGDDVNAQAEPKPEEQKRTVGHPLNGDAVKFNPDDGCIDFTQFCTLMVFCHKLAAQQSAAAGKQLTEDRRKVRDDPEAYKQKVLAKKSIEGQFVQQMIQQIFMKLGVSQQQFEQTMPAYMSNPEKGPILQNLLRQVQEVPQISLDEAEKIEKLSRERLLEVVKVQMEQQVKSLTKMINLPPAASPQEHSIRMMIMQAEDVDIMFEKTGVELENFNYQVISTELNKDPEFLKVIDDAQAKIAVAQQEAQAKMQAAAPQPPVAEAEAKPEEPKAEEN